MRRTLYPAALVTEAAPRRKLAHWRQSMSWRRRTHVPVVFIVFNPPTTTLVENIVGVHKWKCQIVSDCRGFDLCLSTIKIDSFCITDLIAVSKISEKNSSFLVQFTILFVMLRLTQALHFQAIFAVFKDFVSAFNWDSDIS